jgi:hypothetical protein
MANSTQATTNILYWNSRGIQHKFPDLINLMNQHVISIALIDETFLTPDKTLREPGYSIYRNDRAQQGGGTAIIITSDIQYYELPTPIISLGEATSIKVLLDSKPVTLTSAYFPPRDTTTTTSPY